MVCASLSLNGKDGLTALIWASNKGHTATVQLLLGAGADKDAENQVREKKKKYTQRHMWLTSLFGEEAPCDLSTKCCS
jgi:ankyrin repeat protein